jgi:hypothetical protein
MVTDARTGPTRNSEIPPPPRPSNPPPEFPPAPLIPRAETRRAFLPMRTILWTWIALMSVLIGFLLAHRL